MSSTSQSYSPCVDTITESDEKPASSRKPVYDTRPQMAYDKEQRRLVHETDLPRARKNTNAPSTRQNTNVSPLISKKSRSGKPLNWNEITNWSDVTSSTTDENDTRVKLRPSGSAIDKKYLQGKMGQNSEKYRPENQCQIRLPKHRKRSFSSGTIDLLELLQKSLGDYCRHVDDKIEINDGKVYRASVALDGNMFVEAIDLDTSTISFRACSSIEKTSSVKDSYPIHFFRNVSALCPKVYDTWKATFMQQLISYHSYEDVICPESIRKPYNRSVLEFPSPPLDTKASKSKTRKRQIRPQSVDKLPELTSVLSPMLPKLIDELPRLADPRGRTDIKNEAE